MIRTHLSAPFISCTDAPPPAPPAGRGGAGKRLDETHDFETFKKEKYLQVREEKPAAPMETDDSFNSWTLVWIRETPSPQRTDLTPAV